MPSAKKDDGRTLLGEGGHRVVGKKDKEKKRKDSGVRRQESWTVSWKLSRYLNQSVFRRGRSEEKRVGT